MIIVCVYHDNLLVHLLSIELYILIYSSPVYLIFGFELHSLTMPSRLLLDSDTIWSAVAFSLGLVVVVK